MLRYHKDAFLCHRDLEKQIIDLLQTYSQLSIIFETYPLASNLAVDDIETAKTITEFERHNDLGLYRILQGMDFLQKVVTHTKTDDILKEINWLGEAKEMGKRDLSKIERYTDMNLLNDSVKHLASVMGLKKEEKIMDSIMLIHKLEKSMSPNLISYRTEIMNRLLKVADRMYSNAKAIHGAF